MEHPRDNGGDEMSQNWFAAIMAGQRDIKQVTCDGCTTLENELMDVQEFGEWSMDSPLAKADRRLEEDVPETKHHWNKPSNRDLDPGFCANTYLRFVMKHPHVRRAGVEHEQALGIFEERKDYLAFQRQRLFETKAHKS